MKKIFIAARTKTAFDSSLILIYFLMVSEFLFSFFLGSVSFFPDTDRFPAAKAESSLSGLPGFIVSLLLLMILKVCLGSKVPKHHRIISFLLDAVILCYLIADFRHVFRTAYSFYIFA